MRLGKVKITGSRWPWQEGYSWRSTRGPRAMLNPNGARFGGGWRYKFGISVGSKSVILDLLFGIVRISWHEERKS